MKKIVKRLLIFTSSFFIIGSGTHFRLCKNNPDSFSKQVNNYQKKFVEDDFLIAAHRGFSSLAVENTKEAISIAAHQRLVDFIELDVRLTKDNKLVLSHNNEIINQYGNNISIDDSLSSELLMENLIYNTFPISFNNKEEKIISDRTKKLNGTSYNIPSLLEGLCCCGNKNIFLDLKFENNTKIFVDTLLQELHNINTDSIIFQSSDLEALKYLQKLNPDYCCLALIHKKQQLKYASSFDGLGLRKNLVQRELVRNSLEYGKYISVWTINKTQEVDKIIEELDSSYKDVIYITDYPDVIAYSLQEKAKQMKKTNPH